jgi:voltage-dependent anion channel protein 2
MHLSFLMFPCGRNDGQEFGGSIYQKVSPKLDTAIDLNWTAGSNETRFGIGCKYELDKEASVRAKVNNLSQIGLGYQQKLREGRVQVISLHE